MIGKTFQITYKNSNTVQTKILIDHVIIEEKNILNEKIIYLKKKKDKSDDEKIELDNLESSLYEITKKLKTYDMYFTNKSPLGQALINQTMLELPITQGGLHDVVFQQID